MQAISELAKTLPDHKLYHVFEVSCRACDVDFRVGVDQVGDATCPACGNVRRLHPKQLLGVTLTRQEPRPEMWGHRLCALDRYRKQRGLQPLDVPEW